jgi:hypothetical protein
LPIKEVNTCFMTMCNLSHRWLLKIHDHEFLTLSWRSFSWWGRELFNFCFAYKGSQYFIYDYLQPLTLQSTYDPWRRIVAAPLTLNFRLGPGAFHFLYCLSSQSIRHIYLFATYRLTEILRYITKNRWRCVDAQFATGVSTIWNVLIWRIPSFTLSWKPIKQFRLLSSWSLHCCIIIHKNISFKIYFTVPANSGYE